jgi:hypothetical protein
MALQRGFRGFFSDFEISNSVEHARKVSFTAMILGFLDSSESNGAFGKRIEVMLFRSRRERSMIVKFKPWPKSQRNWS